MMVILWYVIKVIIGSGILTGYYFLVLRDKIFHKWNRFFLLTSVIIALALPLIRINIFESDVDNSSVVHLIRNINSQDDTIVRLTQSDFGTGYLWTGMELIWIIISMVLGIILINSISRIYKWKQIYPKTKMDDIDFFDTNLKSAPFSFFNTIFWNRSIAIDTRTGKQILQHEITHVKELHTYDKIFMNIVLVVFWMNPFFYVMKKELSMIHEFIADQAAIPDNDVDAYSAMILKSVYPDQQFSITNNFFYSPLKRRLFMLVKNQNPTKNYIGRLIAIPLLVLIFSAFTLKIKEITKSSSLSQELKSANSIAQLENKITLIIPRDTVPDLIYQNKKVSRVEVNKDSKYLTVTFIDGSKKKILKKDMPPPPPPPTLKIAPPPPPPAGPRPPKLPERALYTLNGTITTSSAIANLNTADIKQVNVLKSYDAIRKYGDKGKDGAIEIITDANLLPTLQLEKTVEQGSDGITFTKVEQEATFPGGSSAWVAYITNIIKNNVSSLSLSDRGTCVVKFIVEKDGSISDVKAMSMKGTKLSDIAVNAIKDGPKWNPAVQNGNIVRSYREQPVSFSIQ